MTETPEKNLVEKWDKWWRGLDLFSCICILALCVIYQDYMALRQKMVLVQSDLNNTQHADQTGLIFNRNPKAGSETIWSLIDRLSKVNNFTSYSDSPEVKEMRGSENTYMWRTNERHEYIRLLSVDSETNMSRPFSYVKHLNFLDLTELNYTNPIYINFVRHPVDRVISWYYYVRQPTYLLKYNEQKNETELHPRRSTIGELKTAYEDCVLNKVSDCVFEPGQAVHASFGTRSNGGSHFSQIGFFCGMGPECNFFESDEALATAKRNVEQHYAVVGVLEQMQVSLEILENFIPRYFKGARKVYKEIMAEKHVNKNMWKPKTPSYIQDILKKNFTNEIEFYEFCKQRLHRQYLTIL